MNIKIESNVIKAIIELDPKELEDLESLLVSISNVSNGENIIGADNVNFAIGLLNKLDKK